MMKTEREKMLNGELYSSTDSDLLRGKSRASHLGVNFHVGKNFYMNAGCVILDCARVDIGDNVMFGPNVQIYTVTHPIKSEARKKGKQMAYPIKICDNVWIGGGSIVLPGITIGKNSVVAAGAVVTKDVPENVVVGGNPANIIELIDNDQNYTSSVSF
ncbi:Maltose O-acetyltransferase [Smittium mucronatum]|uniref:Maltose O-acetyltransferase n=1 Tax=Smittium mucronatum TaxID=133383 RepID=A0A1R0H796_9FUNG|nr:Maltose O-acetyltransferase [Smittium mucronatum]